jgi:hypothetical protein
VGAAPKQGRRHGEHQPLEKWGIPWFFYHDKRHSFDWVVGATDLQDLPVSVNATLV